MSTQTSCRRRRRAGPPRGFTLIELLVVIAIIALLVSILLPSLKRAKDLANQVKCTTNLSALGKASQMYAGDNDGYVPRDYYSGANDSNSGNFGHYLFASRLSQYVGGDEIHPYYDDPANGERPPGADDLSFDEAQDYLRDKFRTMDALHCPTLPVQEYVLHYVVNGVDFAAYARGDGWKSSPASKASKVPGAMADVIYITEANIDSSQIQTDWFGYYDILGPGHMPYNEDDEPQDDARMIAPTDERHMGKTTVVYFDGHGETIELNPQDLQIRAFNPLYEEDD